MTDRLSFLERMEFPVLDVAQARRKALTDQAEQRKDVVACLAGICEQLLNLQNDIVVEQSVEHVDNLALSRDDRQDAVVTVLVGKPIVEFRAGFAAIMKVDVAASGSPVAGAEALPVG